MPQLALLTIAVWALLVWVGLRPAEIVSDWHGWRQSDTQTIALNFMAPGSSILWPQIAWGGSGPGYVETEFQLYTRLVAAVMQATGPSEWAGQLISLLAIVLAAGMVFLHIARTYSLLAAVAGLATFLVARSTLHLATVVMPDALALLFYVTAWLCISAYAANGRGTWLLAYGVVGTLAMLTKPTTAQLGISSFLLIVAAHRDRLRDPRLLLTWAAMVTIFVAYLVHAHGLYVVYGNTFGLLFGEDSKVPALRNLATRQLWTSTARLGLGWGLDGVALAALTALTLRRRWTKELVALAVGGAVMSMVAMRYMSGTAGLHYWAPNSLLAAIAVAKVAQDLAQIRFTRPELAAALLLLVAQGASNAGLRLSNEHSFRTAPEEARVVATGRRVREFARPNDLIVVRSPRTAVDAWWQQAANYHDPRIFYVAGMRGWTLASDVADTRRVEQAAAEGAQWLADPVSQPNVLLEAWLTRNADLVWNDRGAGRIWRLRSQTETRVAGPPASGP